jgi:type II secretory pathway pseudopilin PulG
MLSSRDREGGFSLVELVVAMFVMALVIMAIITVQAQALATNADSAIRQQATAVANEAIEDMRAMPWLVLTGGLDTDFLAASGGDPHVFVDEVEIHGDRHPLVISDQDLDEPWSPLFDGDGSHTAEVSDPSGAGDDFVVRSYVAQDPPCAPASDCPVDLFVIVEWDKRTDGSTEQTILESTAFAPTGGCGDLGAAPFLASCQAIYSAGASSGNVSIAITGAEFESPNSAPVVPESSFYELDVSTARAGARISSQQFNSVTSTIAYGGTLKEDNDDSTDAGSEGWTRGFEDFELKATDDTTTSDAPPPNPTNVLTSMPESIEYVTGGGSGSPAIRAMSDYSRDGELDASVLQSCGVGVGAAAVPAGQPCANATIDPATAWGGYAVLDLHGETLRMARVLNESGSSEDVAWAARFSNAALGGPDTGCQILSDSGCASAGVVRDVGTISIGAVLTGSAAWNDSEAPDGLVEIASYDDRVLVQRGVNQVSAPELMERQASIRYWYDGGYETVSIDEDTSDSYPVGEVTWDVGGSVITASGQITVTPASVLLDEYADPTCARHACEINAAHGQVRTTIDYRIQQASGADYVMTVSTSITGGQAGVSYKEAGDA